MRVSVKMPRVSEKESDLNDKLYEEYKNLIESCKKYKETANPFDIINNDLLYKSLKFAKAYEDFYNFWIEFEIENNL